MLKKCVGCICHPCKENTTTILYADINTRIEYNTIERLTVTLRCSPPIAAEAHNTHTHTLESGFKMQNETASLMQTSIAMRWR